MRLRTLITAALSLLAGLTSNAAQPSPTERLIRDVLNEPVSTVFEAPTDALVESDYKFEVTHVSGPASKIAITVRLAPNSIEWVRTRPDLVLPRAQAEAIIADTAIQTAQITTGGKTFPYSNPSQHPMRFSLALVSGSANPIEIELESKSGQITRLKAEMVFTEQALAKTPIIHFDNDCVSYRIQTRPTERIPRWTFVGCKLIWLKQAGELKPHLQLTRFSDGTPETLSDDHYSEVLVTTESFSGGGHVAIVPDRIDVSATVPDKVKRGNLRLGLGPYYYEYHSDSMSRAGLAVMPTLYASYTLTDTIRVAAFSMVAPIKTYFADNGLYLFTEQARLFDRKLSFSLLLGGHHLAYYSPSGRRGAFSAPQGFELQYRGLFNRPYAMTLGAFIYPTIGGRRDQNIWLRYGSSRWFVELNYLSWKEPYDGNLSAHSSAFGLSVGFPQWGF